MSRPRERCQESSWPAARMRVFVGKARLLVSSRQRAAWRRCGIGDASWTDGRCSCYHGGVSG
eukprot:7341632-Pyramimonas_sp.AAC.1